MKFLGAPGNRVWWINRLQPRGQAEPQQGGHHGVTFVFARSGQRHLIHYLECWTSEHGLGSKNLDLRPWTPWRHFYLLQTWECHLNFWKELQLWTPTPASSQPGRWTWGCPGEQRRHNAVSFMHKSWTSCLILKILSDPWKNSATLSIGRRRGHEIWRDGGFLQDSAKWQFFEV